MSIQTGYEDRKEKDIPPPEKVKWRVELSSIGESEHEKDKIFVRIEIDGDVIGMLRLPDTEYLIWLRERIQT
ncbi:MAG: hypothetical protein IIC79_00020 [Chloroflexi bacterium]|nr:hypothetical protein [Chloroflexota bacterium]